MSKSRLFARGGALTSLLCVGALVTITSACGSTTASISSSPKPTVAPSVPLSAFPTPATTTLANGMAGSLGDPTVVEVFMKDGGTEKQLAAMAREIALMPEVRQYAFVTKDEALAEFRAHLGPGEADQILGNLQVNPLPASFRIQVKDPAQAEAVASRFFYDSRVDNDPGTTNGVSYSRLPISPSPTSK